MPPQCRYDYLPSYNACKTDSDCEVVFGLIQDGPNCCPVSDYGAVNKKDLTAFNLANQCKAPPSPCPELHPWSYSGYTFAARCVAALNKCGVVKVSTTPERDAGPAKQPVVCNTVPTGLVSPHAIGGFQPLTGGPIASGRYKLTAATRYINGTSGTSFPQFGAGLEIQGATLQLAFHGPSSPTYSYTFSAAGSTLTLSQTCPATASARWPYQASGDTLVLFGTPYVGDPWYLTFQKQP